MSEPSRTPERLLQDLSALHDGELDAAALAALTREWAAESELRADWHTYALIGDVLRSDDLASPADHDSAFLQRLRGRLADEPVVFAPMPASKSIELPAQPAVPMPAAVGDNQRRWFRPAAVGAACMAVAGVAMVLRLGDPTPTGDVMAQAGTATAPAASSVQIVRNAELDRYLSAHRQFAQGAALASPAALRQVAVTPDGR